MTRPDFMDAGHSAAEDLFIQLFCDTFGPERTQYLYMQYPFTDIYGGQRYIDFTLRDVYRQIAFEIDGDRFHNPSIVSADKYHDDLLKQNSMSHQGWQIFRWAYAQMRDNPTLVKDELRTFLGEQPLFREPDDFMPSQRGNAFSLRNHQQEALDALQAMRARHETIALLYHATGTGKTVTAISDAKRLGGRTLFLAHTKELVTQAANQFRHQWPEANVGIYMEAERQKHAHVVCGSIQSVSQNLADFKMHEFDYLIIDECHHGTADTYQHILGWFKPKFTLGLTATPERADGEDLLKIFKSIAHKLDLQTAVEIGELVPVRCIRIRTNIDLSSVRFSGFKYNAQELESKVFVPERNRLIVDTWLSFVKDKATVVFCVSVDHAKEIAALLLSNGVESRSVSGNMRQADRAAVLADYEARKVKALCACDLLNEGWDSPHTEVLFMARPTLSKTLYTQQLGRGMRRHEGKEALVVFDFVDNAGMWNQAYSAHRLLQLKDYRPGSYVLAPDGYKQMDLALYNRGEKPCLLVDYPINAYDYEAVDIFSWQDEAAHMVSQLEFVRRVDVQSETIEKYMRDGRMKADLQVPMSENRSFKYFHEESVKRYAQQFGWTLITPANKTQLFLEMVQTMDMAYSYKPVFLLAFFDHADDRYRANLTGITENFTEFYAERGRKGLPVEKGGLMTRDGYTPKEVERLILVNPFKRFQDMGFMRHSGQIGIVELDSTIARKLTTVDVELIRAICVEKLAKYYKKRLGATPDATTLRA